MSNHQGTAPIVIIQIATTQVRGYYVLMSKVGYFHPNDK